MKPERWQQIDEVFVSALEIDPDKRSTFLDEVCAGDQELRQEVEALLESDQQAHSFIEKPPLSLAAELLQANQAALSKGDLIANYKIVSLIGIGGMGEVYLATDLESNGKVAIKLLPPHLSNDPAKRKRFTREARAISSFSHTNICSIYGTGNQNGIDYIVMEYIEGKTLAERLKKGAIPVNQALNYAIQIADALSKAHNEGIIHRDLKPANIMLTKSTVKLLDFGLVKFVEPQSVPFHLLDTSRKSTNLTAAGSIIGTLQYMSPEQARRQNVDARSDIFSFGCVLYEMLSGKRAFLRKTAADTVFAILNEDPLANDDPNLPMDLKNLISQCLKKEAGSRFQTASDLLNALKTKSRKSRHKFKKYFLIAPILVILLCISFFFYPNFKYSVQSNSLAVMPFVNISKDSNVQYLSDGIAESIVTSLSQTSGIRVIAYAKASQYIGDQTAPTKIGRDLKVKRILIGKIMQKGETLVTAVQLINVANGKIIWKQEYSRNSKDVFAIQEQISKDITENMRKRLK